MVSEIKVLILSLVSFLILHMWNMCTSNSEKMVHISACDDLLSFELVARCWVATSPFEGTHTRVEADLLGVGYHSGYTH